MFYENLNIICVLISLRLRVFLGLYINDGICCYLARHGVHGGYRHLYGKWPAYSGNFFSLFLKEIEIPMKVLL